MSRNTTANPRQQPPAPAFPISLDDVYFTLFRHKWLILICTLLGLGAAAAFYQLSPKNYTSEAKLLIRYVQEGKGPTTAGEDSVKSLDRGGDSILAAEVEIMTSQDLARQVAATVGYEKLAGFSGPGADQEALEKLIKGLSITGNTRRGNVIEMDFSHPDSTVVQPVLSAVIEAYLKRHVEIHRPAGTFDDFLTQQTDQMRARLAQTEEELRKARAKAGIISLEDTRKAQSENINTMKRQLLDAQRLLAERNASVQQSLRMLSGNNAPKAQDTTEAAKGPTLDPSVVDSYRNLLTLLSQLRERERTLLQQFTPESTRVKTVRSQIAEVEEAKLNLEKANPALVSNPQAALASQSATGQNRGFDLTGAYSEIAGLEANLKTLSDQLNQVRAEAAELDALESNIQELERRRSIEESNYRTFAANLERSRMEEALGSGRVTNISRIQNPSSPFQDLRKLKKVTLGLAGGGLGLGLVLAFVIELLLDRTIRRVSQVEQKLGLDVFLSIPSKKKSTSKPGSKDDAALALRAESVPPWEPANALHAYYTALRDRTISFFESRNLNHKPRLVALTGLGKDHGAAEIAAGLAGCLSETGEGKVLFVDMTTGQGAAQQFYQGQSVSSIDEALKDEDRAKVSSNLYVVANESSQPQGSNLPLILPKRFGHLVPKLRASDFDYIIFNLPPVNNLSVTPRLAQHMDVVMMVMESEKTDAASAEKAKNLLSNSKAHVAAILNKTKDYVPRNLVKELS